MICTLTINPAMDRMIYLEGFSRGNTNRIRKQMDALGGKGTHVSVNLGILQCENRAFGIDFGETGLRIEEKLKNEYIDLGFLHYPSGNSRVNYAVVEENGCCTLLSERGKMITREECEALLEKMDRAVKPGDILVLSGDASNTEIPLFYIEVMDRFADRNVRFLLDSSSENLIESLKRKPYMIKPNEDELGQILGRRIESDQAVREGIAELAGMGIECIAVTCGGRGSYVWYQEELYRIHPMEVRVINTIGCGDAFLSGMAYGFDQGLPFTETLAYAAAVSSATAESNSTVGFELERALDLKNRVHIEKL
ncbi:MAG TPA: 1-phosphofructokinase [Lachnospiraceae bacterium]|nr:1-phosphofructokinase [Lachnospiraceae bacterium]